MKKKSGQAPAPLRKPFFVFFISILSVISFAQSIAGTVTGADYKPIGDATVQVKGTRRTALTDTAGRFSIAACGEDVLVVSSRRTKTKRSCMPPS
jgi:hypothetical protein